MNSSSVSSGGEIEAGEDRGVCLRVELIVADCGIHVAGASGAGRISACFFFKRS